MQRKIGTIARGIKGPIIREGDDVVDITIESIFQASNDENFTLRDKDVICITESIVARAQGNYITIDNISEDIRNKFDGDSLGLVFPITSRNRFSLILKGIARAFKNKKIIIILKYPCDDFENEIISIDELDKHNINPLTDNIELKDFRKLFGQQFHEHTGIDYLEYYSKIIEEEGAKSEIILSNEPKTILKYTKQILVCDIHSRFRTKRILKENGAQKVYALDDILTSSIKGSGYNDKFGLLGSNKASEENLKLFPRYKESNEIVLDIQKKIYEKTGKNVEVMIYGDAAWDLVDPVVSPAYTEGLKGKPNEVKIKYLADGKFSEFKGKELVNKIALSIKEKEENLKGNMLSEGTCPRNYIDLIGSLSDLVSGSGDKGTPIVLVQGFFDSYID